MRVFSWVRVLVYAVGLVLLVSCLDLAAPGRYFPNLFGPDTLNLREGAATFVSEGTTRSGLQTFSNRKEGPAGSSETASIAETSSLDSEFDFFQDPDFFDSFFGFSPQEHAAPPRAGSSTSVSHPLSAAANLVQDAVPPEFLAGSASNLEQELQELEKDYEQAYHQLFDEFAFGVLPSKSPPSGPTEETSGSNDTTPPSENTEVEASREGGQGGGAARDTQPEPEPEIFNFLIVGDFSNIGENRRIFRANRDDLGNFVLDNSLSFTLLPWETSQIFIFNEAQRPLSSDLNGDGLVDLVISRRGPLGTALDSFIRQPDGHFEYQAHGFLFRQNVRGFSSFDFNSDGEQDLALIIENNPRLVVYQREDETWKYAREIVLPFVPSLAIVGQGQGILQPPRLYLMDASLMRITYLTARAGGVFFSQPFVPFRPSVHNLDVHLIGGRSQHNVLAVDTGTHILVAERNKLGLDFWAGFDVTYGVPLMMLGDYQRNHTRQLVLMP